MIGKPANHVIGGFTAVHFADQNGLRARKNLFGTAKHFRLSSFNIDFYDCRQAMFLRERV